MRGATASRRQDRAAAAALGTAFFALYLLTLCRTVYWYDSAELVTAAVTIGVTHPPGYPVYTWLGHAFTWLPLDTALAVNAMSATAAAVAVAWTYLVERELHLGRVAAAAGAATLGASTVFWHNAVIAEVYTPAIAAAALVTYLLLRGVREQRPRCTLGAASIAGASLGIHMSIATLGLGFAWLSWLNGRSWKRLAASALAAVAGSTVLLATPLRAARDPYLNACDPSEWGQFLWYVTGGAYRGWFDVGEGVVGTAATMTGSFAAQVGLGGIGLAAVGAIRLARSRPGPGLGLFLMMLGNVGFFFTYGAHDAEVFLLPTTFVLCLWIGGGVQTALDAIATATANRAALGLASALALALPAALIVASYEANDLSSFDEAEQYIDEVESTLPKGSTIVNLATPEEWKRYAVFGMYAQLVQGKRHDVRHWVAPDIRKLARELDSRGPVYLYAPVDMIAYFFEIRPEGPLFRVAATKPGAVTNAPRKRDDGRRTCSTFTPYEVRDE